MPFDKEIISACKTKLQRATLVKKINGQQFSTLKFGVNYNNSSFLNTTNQRLIHLNFLSNTFHVKSLTVSTEKKITGHTTIGLPEQTM